MENTFSWNIINYNINAMRWKSGSGGVCRGYRFYYDSQNRMTTSEYGEGPNLGYNRNRYDENVTYDSYGFLSTEMFGKCSNIAKLRMRQSENANGMVTGMVRRTSTGEYLYTASYYNRKGQQCDELSTYPGGVLIHKSIDYSFTGKPISEHFILYKNGQAVTADMSNEYNINNDALTSTTLAISNNKAHRVSLLAYDDLDRMILNTRSGSAGDVSYAYNLRGWTTDITGKGFCEKLYYTDGPGTPCYNGNISSQQWKADNETDMRGYKFSYDGLNRLTTAVYGERGDMSSNVGRYDEKITGYTANSAITGLQRNGKQNNLTYGLVDDLDITLNGNQLSRIADKAVPMLYAGASDFKDNTLSVTGAEYQYNGNGSLVSDANKGITKIEYDNMNNPRRIQFTNGNVTEYIYSVSGEKLRTIHRTAVANITVPIGSTLPLTKANTLSVDSTDYIDNIIFHNGRPDKFLFNGGYCSSTANYQPVYHYYTQDHLGNNRAVVNENGTLEQVTHYYPFGDVYGDTGLNASAQQHKYNGKELDRMHGLDWYDYGARNYDAVVPQFTTIDRYCEKYYNISPYVYCGDNPMNAVDLHGDSLTLVGNKDDQQEAINLYNDGLGGFYKTSIGNNGSVSVSAVKGKDVSKMTKSQKEVYDKLNTIIGDKNMTKINVCSNSKDVIIGDISKTTMDVGDMAAIKDKKAITPVSTIMHETYENYIVQVEKAPINSAHKMASNLEASITGYMIGPFQRETTSDGLILQVIYPKAKTIIIKLKNGNIDE